MITIYKTPTCAYCIQTIKYLEKKGVSYNVIDVTSEQDEEYNRLSQEVGFSVPLVTDGKTAFCGWNLSKLNGMIA